MGRSCVSNWFVKFSPIRFWWAIRHPAKLFRSSGGVTFWTRWKHTKPIMNPKLGDSQTTGVIIWQQPKPRTLKFKKSIKIDIRLHCLIPPEWANFMTPEQHKYHQIPMMYYFILDKTTCIDSTVISWNYSPKTNMYTTKKITLIPKVAIVSRR